MSSDQITTVHTRRIDSRRFSVGPVVFESEEGPVWVKTFKKFIYLIGKFIERVLRESAAISVFCLLIVWISYFVGVIDRDILLISNGALILLLIIAALLKKRSLRVGETGARRRVRRAFPRGAILRSESHPDLFEEDSEITKKVRSIFIGYLIRNETETVPFTADRFPCNSCVICLIDFVSEDPVQTLLCGHFFHQDCLIQVCNRLSMINILVVVRHPVVKQQHGCNMSDVSRRSNCI
jgi:hypothetical protein